MANRYFVGGGTGNWNSTTNWSDTDGGASGFSVPTSTDDVFLTAASGANTLTVNATSNAKSLTCTGFTGTLDGSSSLTVSGNITFVAGMTLTYSGTLTVNATATLTSGGKTLPGNLTLPTALITITFADNWYIVGNYSVSNTTVEGGKTISVEGNVTTPVNNGVPISFCTVKFVGAGTQTLSTLGAIRMNVLIDKSGGDLTMLDASASGIRFFGESFTVAGTNTSTIVAPTLFDIRNNSTLDVDVINWNNVSINTPLVTLTTDIIIDGTLSFGSSAAVNGSDILANGSVTTATAAVTGTSDIILQGTGTWSSTSTGSFANNVIINTSGTITIGSNVIFRTGVLTYITGTVVTTGSTLTLTSSCTLNTSGMSWNNVTFSASSATFTLTTDLNINGTFSQTSGSNITFNGADVYCNGSVAVAAAGTRILGTTDFFFSGTGTWSGAQAFACNITVTGTYTLSGTTNITGNCIFTCTSGTLITTGSTFGVSNITTANVVINTNQTLNNLSSQTATITLSQAIVLLGTLSYLNNATITINGFDITIGGSLSLLTSTLAVGTTNLILNGTGVWSGSGVVRNNLTFNTSGIITISGAVGYNTGTITYTSGTIVTTGSTVNIAASTTLNTDGIIWNNITISATSTITNNSLLTVNNNLTYAAGSIITFAGTFGWIATNFFILTSNNISHVLAAGKTYTVTTYFESIATTSSLKDSLISSIPGTKAIFTLDYGATQNVGYTNATDIDSSRGQTIWTFNGVVTTTFNWNAFTSSSGNQKTYII